jgi:single-stranded DNA-binding protein
LGTFKIKNIRSYNKNDGTEVTEETIVEFQTWNKKLMQGFGLYHVGMALTVNGRLKGNSWIKEGKTINKVNFIVESIEIETPVTSVKQPLFNKQDRKDNAFSKPTYEEKNTSFTLDNVGNSPFTELDPENFF